MIWNEAWLLVSSCMRIARAVETARIRPITIMTVMRLNPRWQEWSVFIMAMASLSRIGTREGCAAAPRPSSPAGCTAPPWSVAAETAR